MADPKRPLRAVIAPRVTPAMRVDKRCNPREPGRQMEQREGDGSGAHSKPKGATRMLAAAGRGKKFLDQRHNKKRRDNEGKQSPPVVNHRPQGGTVDLDSPVEHQLDAEHDQAQCQADENTHEHVHACKAQPEVAHKRTVASKKAGSQHHPEHQPDRGIRHPPRFWCVAGERMSTKLSSPQALPGLPEPGAHERHRLVEWPSVRNPSRTRKDARSGTPQTNHILGQPRPGNGSPLRHRLDRRSGHARRGCA